MRQPLGLDVRLAGGQPQIIRKATREIYPGLKEADIQPVKKARGGGRGRTRNLPQHRVLVLAAETRSLIAEAKAYGVRVISNGSRILTEKYMRQLKQHYHEVHYSPKLYLPARQL
jgi:hypothetical protein